MSKTPAGKLKGRGVSVASAMLMCVAIGVSQSAYAQSGRPLGPDVSPIFKSGNPTCSQLLTGIPGLRELRANSPTDLTYTDGSLSVDIDIRNTGAGPVFDWSTSSGVTIHGIFVKGGPNGNLYNYAAGNPPVFASSDDGLHSPVNDRNGNFYGLSHISFCYVPGAASIKVSKTCQGSQSINGDIVTQRNEVVVTNDGDFDLSNISLRENTGSLSCAIDGGAALPPMTDVGVLGSLAKGASTTFNVVCTGSAVNVVNSITATGHAPSGPTSDSDDNDPAQECPPPPVNVSIDKNCPNDNDVRLKAVDGKLVVQVCPTIKVKNTSSGETLSSVIVEDALIGLNRNVGPLAAGQEVTISDSCYYPAAPEQMSFGDGVYTPTGSSFLNTAKVTATGQFGRTATAMDSAGKGECDLCVCDGEACE